MCLSQNRISVCNSRIKRKENFPLGKEIMVADKMWRICNNVKHKISQDIWNEPSLSVPKSRFLSKENEVVCMVIWKVFFFFPTKNSSRKTNQLIRIGTWITMFPKNVLNKVFMFHHLSEFGKYLSSRELFSTPSCHVEYFKGFFYVFSYFK